MGDSGHRSLSTVALGVAVAVLAAACSGGAGNDASASADPERRCDLGFNTARFNEVNEDVDHSHAHVAHGRIGEVDFTLEQWADVFADDRLGVGVDQVVAEVTADEIYRRHVLGGVLTHSLDADPWMPMGHGATCDELADQVRAARDVVTKYPTVADALAGGYTLGDRYFAGLGVHFQNWDLLGAFDPGRPVQLLYDGTDGDSSLVGLSYVVSAPGDTPPVGFAGDNDRWHKHNSFCLDAGTVNLSSDVLTPAECAELGGSHVLNPDGWMLHTWVVPGCESDWGLFSGANPRLPYIPEGVPLAPGCNSGKTVADPLDVDESGAGPEIR